MPYGPRVTPQIIVEDEAASPVENGGAEVRREPEPIPDAAHSIDARTSVLVFRSKRLSFPREEAPLREPTKSFERGAAAERPGPSEHSAARRSIEIAQSGRRPSEVYVAQIIDVHSCKAFKRENRSCLSDSGHGSVFRGRARYVHERLHGRLYTPFPLAQAQPPKTRRMKIATFNVNGIRKRAAEVLAWMKLESPDVACLQEIKASPEQVADVISDWADLADYRNYWHGNIKGYSGVSIHLRKSSFPEVATFSHPEFDHETRIVEARTGEYAFVSVYVPNGGKDFDAKMRFLEKMPAYVAALHDEGKKIVLCGDLNVARSDIDVHPSQRKAGTIGQRPEERALLEAIIAAGLVDTARSLDPDNDRLFTWWPYWREARPRNVGWRLDYVLASAEVFRPTSCVVQRDVGTSDHAPVVATFDPTPSPG
jgi:exodeoxyribonuclease III